MRLYRASPPRQPYDTVVFFAVLLLALAYGEGMVARELSRPWMVLLGEASYSLYLLHLPILLLLERVPGAKAWRESSPLSFFLFYLPLCIGVSILVLRAYEEPMRRRARQALTDLTTRIRRPGRALPGHEGCIDKGKPGRETAPDGAATRAPGPSIA